MTSFSGSIKPNKASRLHFYMACCAQGTNWQFLGWHPSGCGKIRLRWRWP